MNVNMNRIETLEELIESYKKCPYKVETYEFDGTGYALLIIEINKMLKENQKLKEDILFCLKSIEQEMEMSTDSRTKQEMLSCYQILSKWSDK